MNAAVAKRYGQALLQIGQEKNSIDRYQEDLKLVVDTMENSAELKDVLTSQTVSVDEKKNIVKQIFADKVDTMVLNLMYVVVDKNREESIADMFLGNIGGCIGEVCTAALLVGGIYLIWKGIISVRIPAAYLGTVAVLTLIFSKGDHAVLWMLYSLLGGGVVLGALFMATDYATSPVTPKGQIIYGIGCGVFTVIFRYFGLFPEGVTYAILLMNACSWVIDRYCAPRRFGTKKGEVA